MASRRLHFFALLLLGISSTSSTSTSRGTPLQWSVSIHANTECGGQNLTRCAEVFSRALELGATAVRTDIFWQDLEPTADGGVDHDACGFYAAYFALARDMGLEPVVILSGAPSWAKELITTGGGDNDDVFFARVGAFVDVALSEVVAASGASPAVFQLWNELNDPITSGWLTLSGADHACRLLRVMGGKVGAAYPNATRFVNLLVDELPWQRSLDRWLEPDCAGEALPTTTDAVPPATVAKAAANLGRKEWQGRQRLRGRVDKGKEMASRSSTARAFIDGAALDHYPGTWSTPRNFTDWRSLQTLLQRVTDASHDDNPWLGLAAAVFETGYSSWNGVASSESDQERWVRESLPAMRAVIDEFAPSSRVGGAGAGKGKGMASGDSPTPFLVNMYQLVDSAEHSQESVSVEGHFGFVFDEPSLGPKPAFAALQAEMMADAVYSNRLKSRPPFNVGNGVVVSGPYEASNKTLSFSGMDSSSPLIDVFFPSLDQEQHEKKEKQTRQGGNADERGGAASATSFPLIVYAHGKTSATPEEHYPDLFRALVSFGFVVIAPRACANGCDDDRASLPRDPPGFAHCEFVRIVNEHVIKRGLHLNVNVVIFFFFSSLFLSFIPSFLSLYVRLRAAAAGDRLGAAAKRRRGRVAARTAQFHRRRRHRGAQHGWASHALLVLGCGGSDEQGHSSRRHAPRVHALLSGPSRAVPRLHFSARPFGSAAHDAKLLPRRSPQRHRRHRRCKRERRRRRRRWGIRKRRR